MDSLKIVDGGGRVINFFFVIIPLTPVEGFQVPLYS